MPASSVEARDPTWLERDRSSTRGAIDGICANHLSHMPARVCEAICYSLSSGGKLLRGSLFQASYRAAGGLKDASVLAAAIEVVHAYSLVHDDLPCMDNDDVRRGKPAVHRVYGVATATAAGLAMVPLAARCAARASRDLDLPEAVVGAIVGDLMRASGAGGMIGGQLLDLEGESAALDVASLERIHRAKTGALIAAAATLGGRAALASPQQVDALGRYGQAIGLAFQIADDVLDVTSTTDQLGKTAGRDVELHKSTYPALLGIEGAKQRAEALVSEACDALSRVGLLTSRLEQVARFIVARTS